MQCVIFIDRQLLVNGRPIAYKYHFRRHCSESEGVFEHFHDPPKLRDDGHLNRCLQVPPNCKGKDNAIRCRFGGGGGRAF